MVGRHTCSPRLLRGMLIAHDEHFTVGRTTEARSFGAAAAGMRGMSRDMAKVSLELLNNSGTRQRRKHRHLCPVAMEM